MTGAELEARILAGIDIEDLIAVVRAMSDALERNEAELRAIESALAPLDVRAGKDPVEAVRRLVARVVGVVEE